MSSCPLSRPMLGFLLNVLCIAAVSSRYHRWPVDGLPARPMDCACAGSFASMQRPPSSAARRHVRAGFSIRVTHRMMDPFSRRRGLALLPISWSYIVSVVRLSAVLCTVLVLDSVPPQPPPHWPPPSCPPPCGAFQVMRESKSVGEFKDLLFLTRGRLLIGTTVCPVGCWADGPLSQRHTRFRGCSHCSVSLCR